MGNIVLTNPQHNQRQVSPGTNIDLEVTGITTDGYGPDLTTLNVQVNGESAIKSGTFQRPSVVLSDSIVSADGSPPSSTTRFFKLENNPFMTGDEVDISTSEGEFLQTKIIGIKNSTIEVRNTVFIPDEANQPSGFQIDIAATSRGYLGSIGSVVSEQSSISINPLKNLPINKVIFVIAEVDQLISSGKTEKLRKVFIFRTSDSIPPQIINFPQYIKFSNLSFKIVDILGNQVLKNTLNVYFDDNKVVDQGIINDNYTGSLIFRNNSELDTYIRPKLEFEHNQKIDVQVEVADGYANQTVLNKEVINKSLLSRVHFISITPNEESVLDPTSDSITIDLRVDNPLDKSFINVNYTVDGVEHKAIKAGEFQDQHTGIIRGTKDITIQIDDLEATSFNKDVVVSLVLQEVTELGDIPLGSNPFYVKDFNFVTISATLAPVIDTIFPNPDSVISPDTQIRFTAVSQVQGATMNTTATTVSVNGVLAIDQGLFVNGYTGSLLSKQGSQDHALNAIIIPPNSFEIGSSVEVQIQISDIAGNSADEIHTFNIANTNLPIVTAIPPGSVYNELTRISLKSDQPAVIYYTLDGSTPTQGSINTFSQASPISNIPIFREGITQVRAFAINQNQIKGETITEIYDLNPFIPEVSIISPTNNTLLQKNSTIVEYEISLQRGFLTKVEFIVNNGVPQDVQNTLLDSSVSIVGLTTGTNSIKIRATDNAGNVGVGEVFINVQASQIIDFALQYAPLRCPRFPERAVGEQGTYSNFIDTGTVAIIGLGSRREVLVSFGLGDGLDGEPIDFAASNSPDSRHFSLSSFPIREDSLKVILVRNGRELVLSSNDYVLDSATGRIVLDHPIEERESLIVEYIADPDVNVPTLFLPSQLNQLYKKHGNPNQENTLSLAAQIAFENGAKRVLAIQGEVPEVDPSWTQSFSSLENQECYWVTPVVRNQDINLYPSILVAAFNHVELMSKIISRKERVVSAWRLPDSVNDFGQARIFLADIDLESKITRIVQGENVELNGSFISAAISGKGSGLSKIALPLTDKQLVGFSFNTLQKSPTLKLDRKLKEGFLPVLATASGAKIHRGRSGYTGLTDPIKEELSVQRTIDWLSKNLRRLVENRFKGRALTSSTISTVELDVNNFLEAQNDKISEGFVSNVEVDQQEPRQLNLDVTISPLFPLNEFNITFSLLTTL